jgi:D-alanyl-D-alanine dipeptidase
MTRSLGGHASAVIVDALRRRASRPGWRMWLKSYNPNVYFLYHPQTGPHAGGDAVDLSLEHIAAFLDSELVIRSSTVGELVIRSSTVGVAP